MDTIVSLKEFPADGGAVRLDVNVENVPKDLFGAAFHLKIGSNDWHLLSYERGGVFGEGVQPVIMAAETTGDSHEIVFGITLKNGDRSAVRDGRLVSFYLKPAAGGGNVDAGFSDTHMSVLSGGRVDLKNVEWRGTGTQFVDSAEVGQASVLAGSPLRVEPHGAGTYDGFYWTAGLSLLIFLAVSGAFALLWKVYFARFYGRKAAKDQEILT